MALQFKKSDKDKFKEQVQVSKDIKKLYKDAAKNIQKQMKSIPDSGTSNILNRQRLSQLQAEVNRIIDEISIKEEEIIKDSIKGVAEDVVNDNMRMLESIGFNKEVLQEAYANVPTDIVNRMVSGEIYEGGWNLSNAIWSDNEITKKDLYSIVAQGLVENKGILEIAESMERYVNPNKLTMWNLKMTDGRHIYKRKVDYNSQRLARTLVQHSYQQSVIEETKDNPFINKWVWRANGPRACPICQEMNGTVYNKAEDIPMDHPNGMCTIDVQSSDTMVEDLRNWLYADDGEYPEIDEFAESLGYKHLTNNKNEIVNPNLKGKIIAIMDGDEETFKNADELRERYKDYYGFKDEDIDLILRNEWDGWIDIHLTYEHDNKLKIDLDELKERLQDYVAGGYFNVEDALTKEQYSYVKSSMKDYKRNIYRLEEDIYTAKNLSVGDEFSFANDIRSFSTSRKWINETIEESEWEGTFTEPVLFIVEEGSKVFDMEEYARLYSESYGSQFEVLSGGKFKVKNIAEEIINDKKIKIIKLKSL